MAAAGVPLPRADHAGVMADFALAMLAALERVNAAAEVPFQMRIGIHTGPVVAGVIGSHRFLYDIWGDTVNLASRLESHGLPGRIHVSPQTRQLLEGRYDLEPRGLINLRGIGKIRTAFITGRKGGVRSQFLEREQRVERSATLELP
jgi:adenylate cyclase